MHSAWFLLDETKALSRVLVSEKHGVMVMFFEYTNTAHNEEFPCFFYVC